LSFCFSNRSFGIEQKFIWILSSSSIFLVLSHCCWLLLSWPNSSKSSWALLYFSQFSLI
jgi:hypothetical protein